MWAYVPPVRDMQFVLDELLQVRRDWARIPNFEELDVETVGAILEEAGRFAAQTLAEINASGDREGCRYEDGRVQTPAGFVDAYRQYCEGSWPSMACDTAYGGQGLPQVLNATLYEMLWGTNHAWTMYPGLAHGAYECLRAHGSPEIKALYLPKIVSGEWLSTMCLTEPGAGSDLGLVRTRAEMGENGEYSISGTKIFISGGEHDLTPNIIHLVLARLPDAPVGTRGLSLFLVPKILTDREGSPGNRVRCDGIEHKMGIKGSATCVITFSGAMGWLVGEPHRGLAAMFIMMNSARLYVALQGLGHAEAAYQNAARYAAERLQLRATIKPERAVLDASGADPIIWHPAVRKVLLSLRAFVEGERALGYWSAHLLDLAECHPEGDVRRWANDLVSLLTPIIKSFFTQNGFVLAGEALQVWGGYGYIQGSGIEQTLRDSRIPLIYEGTNEIQSIDLLIRKIIADRGEKFESLLLVIRQEAEACTATKECEPFGSQLMEFHTALATATRALVENAKMDASFAYGVANDFLRLVGLVLVGCFWARASRLAVSRTADPFYQAKAETARFYFDFLLPEARLRLELVGRMDRSVPWVDASGNHK